MGSVEADLNRYLVNQERGEAFMDEASVERKSLVAEYIADNENKNESTLRDYLGDLAGGDPEFLHSLVRGDVGRMQKLFHDAIDIAMGEELVEQRAQRLQEYADERKRCGCTYCTC